MKDSYGRTIDYMRISITRQCNLHCQYCMPKPITSAAGETCLTLEEICAIAECTASLGIRHIRITGGEPLLREDCCLLVSRLKAIPGIETVALTTNGILLEKYFDRLTEAGIDGINISLDTTDRALYKKITGEDRLETVISAIKKAASGRIPVKINAVSLDAGNYLAEEEGLIALAKDSPIDVRFIELMPIGYGSMVSGQSHEALRKAFQKRYPGMEPDKQTHGYGPAVYYRIPGYQGSIGFISAIHEKFCAGCSRIRLTSQGWLKPCLCYDTGADLLPLLRSGKPEEEKKRELFLAITAAVKEKPAGHCFETPDQVTERRSMAVIGG